MDLTDVTLPRSFAVLNDIFTARGFELFLVGDTCETSSSAARGRF